MKASPRGRSALCSIQGETIGRPHPRSRPRQSVRSEPGRIPRGGTAAPACHSRTGGSPDTVDAIRDGMLECSGHWRIMASHVRQCLHCEVSCPPGQHQAQCSAVAGPGGQAHNGRAEAAKGVALERRI